MKTRNGFVSNSSSSSFIIAVKKTNIPCPHCGRKDPDFLDMVEQSSDYISNNCVHTRNTQDTLDVIELDEKTYMEENQYKELEMALAKYIHNDEWVVANISLSTHDQDMRKIMKDLSKRGNLEILYQSEG